MTLLASVCIVFTGALVGLGMDDWRPSSRPYAGVLLVPSLVSSIMGGLEAMWPVLIFGVTVSGVWLAAAPRYHGSTS